MKSPGIGSHLLVSKLGALVALGLALAGCTSEVISYNREFRENGFGQYNRQDYLNAAQSFKEALRDEPGDYVSRYYLGNCYQFIGKNQQAIEEYRTTLQVMSTTSLEGRGDADTRQKVLNAYATALAKESERSADLTRLEAQKPRTAENDLILARVYRQVGDPDLALARYQEAEQLEATNPAIAKEHGLYLEFLGQTARADAELRKAYGMNTHDEEVAAALRRLGVVPGPSLKKEEALEKPLIPLGPIPEIDLSSSKQTGSSSVGATPLGSPRD